ncbi:hypothetical protein Pfo_014382 [Paulownia fortunei]|nr:hypothetical protein Pfo_014382 [Paulownia fortunei]
MQELRPLAAGIFLSDSFCSAPVLYLTLNLKLIFESGKFVVIWVWIISESRN